MNIKSFISSILTLLFSLSASYAQPKYIFYLIGDGMGLNHVNLAEVYLAENKGRIGYEPLVLSNFSHVGFASSNSKSSSITDSGAGGTALAVGYKTKNGVIGMDSAATIPYKSIAYAAKEKGLKVGITSSVSIDHATPASFYAHQKSRSYYYEIAAEIPSSGFDLFAGSGFVSPTKSFDKKDVSDIYNELTKKGYTIVYGKNALANDVYNDKKLIWVNNKTEKSDALKFAIDQKPDDMSLEDITRGAIKKLSHKNNKGFFLMVEGGKIDWSAHANDGATTLKEVLDFNKTIQAAYEFYQKHPNETLIVVTADHETGGLALGNGPSSLNTKALAHQKVSQGALSTLIGQLRKDKPNASWEDVKNLLAANTGLWTSLKVSDDDEEDLLDAYEKSFVNHENETTKSLYANDDKIASLSIKILNKIANIGWSSSNHTAAYVPIYAIGVGAELFNKKMDNTDIPKKIAQAAQLNF
ncbi:alkaline phosphatase [Sphingobacterium bovistauri]|uniref:Alkaline phosphatase n=1 Tax=Sphingobacterium bovistauri TaxID=2781959 RepID=A0ABS7Z3Y2_9SPHI|nr:alkaline phosphatase [Sphingobacterium bovistauri]MCA5004873.1 alkaline phosphatase [Sphingobacterium bovistauri]